MIGTPCALNVLLHAHCSPTPIPNAEASSVAESIRYLENAEMIWRVDRHYETTDKGKFYIEHIMNLPFPKVVFTME